MFLMLFISCDIIDYPAALQYSVGGRSGRYCIHRRSRSHITTDSQSASSSRCLVPFGAGDQMLHLFE
jgi:hypothetical protein